MEIVFAYKCVSQYILQFCNSMACRCPCVVLLLQRGNQHTHTTFSVKQGSTFNLEEHKPLCISLSHSFHSISLISICMDSSLIILLYSISSNSHIVCSVYITDSVSLTSSRNTSNLFFPHFSASMPQPSDHWMLF